MEELILSRFIMRLLDIVEFIIVFDIVYYINV